MTHLEGHKIIIKQQQQILLFQILNELFRLRKETFLLISFIDVVVLFISLLFSFLILKKTSQVLQ